MTVLAIEIGHRIRNFRLQKQLSQEELAERCGLHPTYIGQLERGEKNATMESISKVAAGLGVKLSSLFENIDGQNAEIKNSYPAMAYDLIQSATPSSQKQLVEILRRIIELE